VILHVFLVQVCPVQQLNLDHILVLLFEVCLLSLVQVVVFQILLEIIELQMSVFLVQIVCLGQLIEFYIFLLVPEIWYLVFV